MNKEKLKMTREEKFFKELSLPYGKWKVESVKAKCKNPYWKHGVFAEINHEESRQICGYTHHGDSGKQVATFITAAPDMLVALLKEYTNPYNIQRPDSFTAKTIEKATNRPIEQVLKLWEESKC